MARKLYIGNLSFQTSEEELKALFQQAGTVESVRIITDPFSGRSRGFGFVEMATGEEAAKAIEMFNGHLLKDRTLIVSEARERRSGRGTGRREERGGRKWR